MCLCAGGRPCGGRGRRRRSPARGLRGGDARDREPGVFEGCAGVRRGARGYAWG